MGLNFWHLVQHSDYNDDRAVEVIRKCAVNKEVFRKVLPYVSKATLLAMKRRGDVLDIGMSFHMEEESPPVKVTSDRVVGVQVFVMRHPTRAAKGKFLANRFEMLVDPDGQIVSIGDTTAEACFTNPPINNFESGNTCSS